MTDQKLEIDMAGGLQPGEELFGVIVGTDKGARVVWTPEFLNLPRHTRQQIGAFVKDMTDIVPPKERN